MPFKGTEGKKISMRKARTMIARHRRKNARRAASTAPGTNGGFYGKKTILKILGQRNCVGVRYFHALDAKKQRTIVLVGEDKYGSLLTGLLVEEGPLCPPICNKENQLRLPGI